MRLMVYSHDTFGLGNIQRMLAICKHLIASLPDLSILLVSGSPMLHSFRLPQGLDYIKLPCLNRGDRGELAVKYLGTDIEDVVRLRSDLLYSAATNFKPDLLMVDKKPYGLRHELTRTLNYLKAELPATKLVLLLRDILDSPAATIAEWQSHNYYSAIQDLYDSVLVVGSPEVFDLRQAYQFPDAIAAKVRFCGYIRKSLGQKSSTAVRQELQVAPEERLILVTPGGGEDGYALVENYLSGLSLLPAHHRLKSLLICGPEMPACHREALHQQAAQHPQVQIREFTDDPMSYLAAADGVVAMGGYNTITEILSLHKRAVVVPRIQPSQEQMIRADRLAQLGLLTSIHPAQVTPYLLMQSILKQLSQQNSASPPNLYSLDLDGLPRIAQQISNLLRGDRAYESNYVYRQTEKLCSTPIPAIVPR